MDTLALLREYGWMAWLGWVAVEKLLPMLQLVIEKWFLPTQAAERQARLEEEREEHERKAQLEERHVRVLENFDATLQRVEVTLAGMNTRIQSIERDQDAMRDTLTVLSERFPRKNKRELAVAGTN